MTKQTVELPPQLLEDARQFVDAGYHKDLDQLVAEAVQRYLESHSEAIAEQFILEDIEWGLRGEE